MLKTFTHSDAPMFIDESVKAAERASRRNVLLLSQPSNFLFIVYGLHIFDPKCERGA